MSNPFDENLLRDSLSAYIAIGDVIDISKVGVDPFVYVKIYNQKNCVSNPPVLLRVTSRPTLTRSSSCEWLYFWSCECVAPAVDGQEKFEGLRMSGVVFLPPDCELQGRDRQAFYEDVARQFHIKAFRSRFGALADTSNLF